jgi:hypothetical protein
MAANAKYPSFDLSDITINPPPEEGFESWLLVADATDAAVRSDVAKVDLDLQDFADRGYAVVENLRADRVLYGKFKVLAAAGFFDFSIIERLLLQLSALWYTSHMQREGATQSQRPVPLSLIAQGTERRQRMYKLARYHVEDHVTEGPRLREITLANDHQQLASQLLVLSEIYKRNQILFALDPHYRSNDEADAATESRAIFRCLGSATTHAVSWSDRSATLYTSILANYTELRSTGTWLLRHTLTDAQQRFPSLTENQAVHTQNITEGVTSANDSVREFSTSSNVTKPISGPVQRNHTDGLKSQETNGKNKAKKKRAA